MISRVNNKNRERWLATSDQIEDKLAQSFQRWIAAEDITFKNEGARNLYTERCELIKDAIQMKKKPARIPIWLQCGTFPLEYSGVSWGTAMNDHKATAEAFLKFHRDFPDQDCCISIDDVTPAGALNNFQPIYAKWPGNGLADNLGYQYTDPEIMREDDYQDFIDDPTGWMLSEYFPRAFPKLKGFTEFPSPFGTAELVGIPYFAAYFATPDHGTAFQNLQNAGNQSLGWLEELEKVAIELQSSGYPLIYGGFTIAPFDMLGDTLRGTAGIFKDLFRCPVEVFEACEKLIPLMVKMGIQSCTATGNPLCLIPLHKGADGFMSNEQFETFYWPSLRKLAIGLMEGGIVPVLFAEGGYNQRLETISDLPGGKAIWYFDATDMKRAKETVGQSTCVMGNMPVSVLCAGTVQDVENRCQEIIDAAAENGGFIFSNGAGFDGAKPENINAMISYMRQYGRY